MLSIPLLFPAEITAQAGSQNSAPGSTGAIMRQDKAEAESVVLNPSFILHILDASNAEMKMYQFIEKQKSVHWNFDGIMAYS